jgi:polyphosphate kinase
VHASSAKTTRFKYFNRELSWLAFNRRVLGQAEDPANPLLERMKYLAFVSSNLDEFFEIRVSGLMQQVKSGIVEVNPDGLTTKVQLQAIHQQVQKLVQAQYQCWTQQIQPQLKKQKIFFCCHHELTRNEKQWLKAYFNEQVYPVLTPLAIDPAHPFPQLKNKALYLLAGIDAPKSGQSQSLMAIIQVPRVLPRVVKIETPRRGSPDVYVFLSDVIQSHAQELFPGYKLRSAAPFRITRNSDLYVDEEEVENLLSKIEEQLMQLQKGAAVRLEISNEADPELLAQLLKATQLGPEQVYKISGPINPLRLMSAYDLIDRPELKFTTQIAHYPKQLENNDQIFRQIRHQDILLHHPYDSFQPFIDFLQQAAVDPDVFAIKQTLYRTSGDSPIIRALQEASRRGKQVTVLVEIKARFDEANNIHWARELEEIGVHVVYGLVGLKTHCKTCMVVRKEGRRMRRYVHMGTGNYNPKTAKLYTDLSYFTAKADISKEVANLFNTLTGFSLTPTFKKLLVAPFTLHSKLQSFIRTEIRNAKAGLPARIILQANSLVDSVTIDNLYRASQAGIKVDLIIRGICNLVPGVKGMSENIQVRSVLGRYLEHSRIYYFQNAKKESPAVYAGSADLMPRNFYRRIEALFPVQEPELKTRLIYILKLYLEDNKDAYSLQANGSYTKLSKAKDAEGLSAQETFMLASQKQKQIKLKARTKDQEVTLM